MKILIRTEDRLLVAYNEEIVYNTEKGIYHIYKVGDELNATHAHNFESLTIIDIGEQEMPNDPEFIEGKYIYTEEGVWQVSPNWVAEDPLIMR